ncbi:MAG: DUF4783 domain-containing protein [Bacteroidia bacterium]|nr:DUF4783 domain-containing protein [Bacteroidia bacterium]
MLFRILFPIILFIVSVSTAEQITTTNIPEEIVTAIKTGNAKELAKFFNQNIELVIQNQEDVYSKAQAELIIKDFFSKNTPSDFTILHQGGKEGARYAIGSVKTANGNFRIYFLLKMKNYQPLIHQLKIEKE